MCNLSCTITLTLISPPPSPSDTGSAASDNPTKERCSTGTDCGEPRRTSPVLSLPFSLLSVWLQTEASWLACSTSHPYTPPSHTHTHTQSKSSYRSTPTTPSSLSVTPTPADLRDTRPTAPEPRVSPCRVRWPVASPVCTQTSTRWRAGSTGTTRPTYPTGSEDISVYCRLL